MIDKIEYRYRALPPSDVSLKGGTAQHRMNLNRDYMMSLSNAALLQSFHMEAGLYGRSGDNPNTVSDMHWGWEALGSQLRGHFLGHWISGAARQSAITNDIELKAKTEKIISELALCQEQNGNGWVGSIPEKYLDLIARGKRVWAPHYTIHKTLMGLYDAYLYLGNEQALAVLKGFAGWFINWSAKYSREEFDNILDVETGGMLEAWANLYGATGKPEHKLLMEKYDRPRLFEKLLAGEDPLTNRHMNTTVPEIHGAARAYEVSGEERWRKIVEAYWKCGVTDRGYFCTGGQSSGEDWTPPFEFRARLGDHTQEHCCVYNMMRLADYLFRWTGDISYSDYWERNWYNGILAQQHPDTGMVAYFLPLQSGSQKIWGSKTHDFWCCHGSLVQAHTIHNSSILFVNDNGILLNQYIPSQCKWQHKGINVAIDIDYDAQRATTQEITSKGTVHRPKEMAYEIQINCENTVEFELAVRIPWWVSQKPEILVNGAAEKGDLKPSSVHILKKEWKNDTIRIVFPKKITAEPLPDSPEMVAFMDGPEVLAGLCKKAELLHGDIDDAESMFIPENELQFGQWFPNYRLNDNALDLSFKPINQIKDERYTVYFPVRASK